MGKYLTEIGAANDKASYLKRILYNFEDAQLVMINGQPAGLFKSSFNCRKRSLVSGANPGPSRFSKSWYRQNTHHYPA